MNVLKCQNCKEEIGQVSKRFKNVAGEDFSFGYVYSIVDVDISNAVAVNINNEYRKADIKNNDEYLDMWYMGGGDFLTHLLVVDDEVSILELIKNSLGKDGYLITVCQNADDVDIKKLHFYDLILLDVMMPGTDGFEFCKQIRNMVDCPILFLTAKTLEEDILFGLGIGADDYITKPFRIQELRARVAAHLRREKREHHSTLSFEPDIRFDLSAKVLYVSEQPVPLTKSEYSICEYLAKNRGQVFTKEQIYEAVFGFDGIGDNSTISTHIKNIRAKLEHFKISPISTVWGIGYKWE